MYMETTQAMCEMPKYQSYKIVHALKIKEIVTDNAGNVSFIPQEQMYAPIELDKDYVEKHKPTVGGYYVVYKDGYKSFSPAEAFEEGYTRLSV